MPFFTFLRWILDTAQYCDPTNSFYYALPTELQPHLDGVGTFIRLWMGCAL